MRKIILAICFLITAANSRKVIISFNNEECEMTGFRYINHLSEKAISITPLHRIGMLIVEIEIYALTKFVSEFKEFGDCVRAIEEDKQITVELPKPQEGTTEDKDQWQLKRINVKSLPLPSDIQRRITSSAPVHVIIIDSGIDAKHPDLASRVASSSEHFSFIKTDKCCVKEYDPLCDCAEHGTHCSGIVASPHSGYNPSAILHSIKALNYMGISTNAIVLQSMDKAIELASLHPEETYIVNMSLSSGLMVEYDLAAQKVVNAGIFLVVAAGNQAGDACYISPASAPAAFTVGSSDINDSIAIFSNYGKCVDIFAPGVDINSCKPGGGYQYKSGTSMAAPLVAGFASAIAAAEGLRSPSDIRDAINRHIIKNAVKDAKSENNNLPYDGSDNSPLSFLEQ